MCSTFQIKKFQVHENVTTSYCTSKTRLPQVTPQTSSTNFSQTHSWAGETKSMEASIPELDPVGFWSPKSSSFSGSDSIVVEEAARNFRSPWPNINKSRKVNSFIQHDKVEASKLHRYLETCSHALEQFLQRQTSSNDSIISYSAYR